MTWTECSIALGVVLAALIVFLVWMLATDPSMTELSSMDAATYQWRQMVDGCRGLADAKQSACMALADASFR